MADDVIENAIRLTRIGRFKEALASFQENECYKTNPIGLSYYALCLAVVEKKYKTALSLSAMALKTDIINPHIYLNIGKIYVLAKRKDLAYKAFIRGLMMNSAHPALIKQIQRMGVRRKPVISALSRSNIINRILGLITYRNIHAKQ